MKYKLDSREHDFDLYLLDDHDNTTFAVYRVRFDSVSKHFENGDCFLTFKTPDNRITTGLDLTANEFINLMIELRFLKSYKVTR